MQDFADDERLFRRVASRDWPANQYNLHFLITDPLCTLRERFCESPEDVYHAGRPDNALGVVAWFVGEIPKHHADNGCEAYLRVEHVPEDDVYPHTEVATYGTLQEMDSTTPEQRVESQSTRAKRKGKAQKLFRVSLRWRIASKAAFIADVPRLPR